MCRIITRAGAVSEALAVVLHIDDVMQLDAIGNNVFPCACLQDGCGGECWQGQHLEESSGRR